MFPGVHVVQPLNELDFALAFLELTSRRPLSSFLIFTGQNTPNQKLWKSTLDIVGLLRGSIPSNPRRWPFALPLRVLLPPWNSNNGDQQVPILHRGNATIRPRNNPTVDKVKTKATPVHRVLKTTKCYPSRASKYLPAEQGHACLCGSTSDRIKVD